mmetsp:Transcript_4432/g.10613  ORF Transcript_4432/g.10613 Transcript_4432/m.10613 type:complete len:212 (-) Transcript_4432:360-995(-)
MDPAAEPTRWRTATSATATQQSLRATEARSRRGVEGHISMRALPHGRPADPGANSRPSNAGRRRRQGPVQRMRDDVVVRAVHRIDPVRDLRRRPRCARARRRVGPGRCGILRSVNSAGGGEATTGDRHLLRLSRRLHDNLRDRGSQGLLFRLGANHEPEHTLCGGNVYRQRLHEAESTRAKAIKRGEELGRRCRRRIQRAYHCGEPDRWHF